MACTTSIPFKYNGGIGWIARGCHFCNKLAFKVKEFAGGRYAVTQCKGVESIGPTWKKLNTWLEDSKHEYSHHQWLEEHIGDVDAPPDELVLDLYMPIAA